MATATKRKRTTCPGCKRRLYQLKRQNRDLQGRSWHYACLAHSVSSMRDSPYPIA